MPVWVGVSCRLSWQWSAKLMVWWHGRCVLTSGGGRRITVHAVSWAEGADVLWGLRLCSDGPGAAWHHTHANTPPHRHQQKTTNQTITMRKWGCGHALLAATDMLVLEVVRWGYRDVRVPWTQPKWADSVPSRLMPEFLNLVLAFISGYVGGLTHYLHLWDGVILVRRDGFPL